MIHIISFSGGKDSTALLLMMLEKGMKIDKIINIDTTKEFPEMYHHIEKVQNYILPLKIEIIKIDYDYWFGEHIKTKGKRIGQIGYGWPDFGRRWCTALKRKSFCKTVVSMPYEARKRGGVSSIPKGIVEYHGIAYDEKHRAEKNKGRNILYPLIDWHITEFEALQYCYSHGFDWGGLYEKFHRVSCWCCPFIQIGELRILYFEFPEIWDKLEKMDKKSLFPFRHDYSLMELKNKFEKEYQRPKLFSLYNKK